MLSRQELARVAVRGAFAARRKANLSSDIPICVYDIAETLGLEVWFLPGASFGGMYAKEFGRLFVPVERPPGRKVFTCAHELAHWWFDHGTQIDDLEFDKTDHELPQERLANIFAASFLMPKKAITAEFGRRNLVPEECDAFQLYAVASQFGVGYETLIKHLRWSLNLLSHARMGDLCAIPPKEIRRAVLGADLCRSLVVADIFWHKTAIDLEVGDIAVVPKHARVRGQAVELLGDCSSGQVLRGIAPGIAQSIGDEPEWAAMIRVSRKGFAGRGAYRHLEDPDYDE